MVKAIKAFSLIAIIFAAIGTAAWMIMGCSGFLRFDAIVKDMMTKYPTESQSVIETAVRGNLIAFIVFGLYSLGVIVMCVLTILKLRKKNFTKKKLVLFGILDIVFGSKLSGILLLCLNPNKANK